MTSEPPCVLPVSVMTSRRQAAVQGDTVLWFWGSGEDSLPRGTHCTVYHSSLDRWPQRRKLTRTGALRRPLCRLFVTAMVVSKLTFLHWETDVGAGNRVCVTTQWSSSATSHWSVIVLHEVHEWLFRHALNTYMVLSAGRCTQRDNMEMTVCQENPIFITLLNFKPIKNLLTMVKIQVCAGNQQIWMKSGQISS